MTATRLTRRAAHQPWVSRKDPRIPKPFISAEKAVASDLPDTVAYVSDAGNPSIGFFSMNRESGALTPIANVPIPGADKPSPTSMPMTVSPKHRFLYAGLRSQPYTVASFAIDPATGLLKHLGSAPLADSMAYIVTDRSGRFLLCASYPGSKLAINPIDAQGRVQGPDDTNHPDQAQGALHSGRSDQQILLCDEPRRRHRHGVEIRCGHRPVVAELA